MLPTYLTQPEAEGQENLPGRKVRWSMDIEGQMGDSLAQTGTIISTFQVRKLRIKRAKLIYPRSHD